MSKVPCQCEHELHFADPRTVHEYLTVPAGETCAMFIGPICDACVGHMQGYLLTGEDAERSRKAVATMYEEEVTSHGDGEADPGPAVAHA